MGVFYLSNAAKSNTIYRNPKDEAGGSTSAVDFSFKPLVHEVVYNKFNFLFCGEACVYKIDQHIDRITALPLLLAFSKNEYRNIFGWNSAVSSTTVISGTEQDANTYEKALNVTADELGYIVHMHREENFTNVQTTEKSSGSNSFVG